MDQFKHWYFGEQWKETLSQPDFIQETRQQAIHYLTEHQKNGSFALDKIGSGRGLIIVAGNAVRLPHQPIYSLG